MKNLKIELIEEMLKKRKKVSLPDLDKKRAAVLVPILLGKEASILFTKRSMKVYHHKGQISFPGGVIDATDSSPLFAALREAYEEVGIEKKDVRILGELDDFFTYTTNFIITPYVGVIPYPYNFSVSRDEIEKLIIIPISLLLEMKPREEKWRFKNQLVPVYFFHYEGEVIWGATARILNHFLGILRESFALEQ